MPGLGERIGGGPRLAQGVARVPHHVGDVVDRRLGGDEGVDDGVSAVRAGRHQVAGGDHAGHLGSEGRLVDVVGPAHVAGLDGQMELVADIGPGVATAGGRSVAGPGVGIGGVALTTVGADAEAPWPS